MRWRNKSTCRPPAGARGLTLPLPHARIAHLLLPRCCLPSSPASSFPCRPHPTPPLHPHPHREDDLRPIWIDGDMEEDRRRQAEEKAGGGIDGDMIEERRRRVERRGRPAAAGEETMVGIEGGVRRLVGIEGKEKEG